MAKTPARQALLEHLKRHGPDDLSGLGRAAGLKPTPTRHHLSSLVADGLVESSLERRPVGRPAWRYALTALAEGAFPKHYRELLEVVLEEAEAFGLLGPLLEGVARRMAAGAAEGLGGQRGAAALPGLLARLDFGEMLSTVTETPGGWEIAAHNCLYRDTGCRFEAVCGLVPRVVTLSTGLPSERLACQRDGERACRFTVGRG